MSQHDYNIQDQNGLDFLADINLLFPAIASENSGPTEPTTTFANMKWFDTANDLLKVRNEANSAWLIIAKKDANGWTPYRRGSPIGAIAEKESLEVLDLDLAATGRLLGRVTAGAGTGEELTGAQVRALLNVAQDSTDPDLTVDPNAAARRGLVADAIANQGFPAPDFTDEIGPSFPGQDTTTAFAHGLGSRPSFFQFFAECTTASDGFSVGSRLHLTTYYDGDNNGHTVWADANNVNFTQGDSLRLIAANDSSLFLMDNNANFKLVVEAWK